MIYLALNLVFIAVVLIVMRVLRLPLAKKWYLALIPILVLTMLFDPLIIHFGVVGYDDSTLLGLKFFGAPVEDFMYSVLAAIIVPALWVKLTKGDTDGND